VKGRLGEESQQFAALQAEDAFAERLCIADVGEREGQFVIAPARSSPSP